MPDQDLLPRWLLLPLMAVVAAALLAFLVWQLWLRRRHRLAWLWGLVIALAGLAVGWFLGDVREWLARLLSR